MEFLLLSGALLVLSLLMTVDTSWNNVLTALRNQLVFADRNKEYGAFELRRSYVRRLGVAVASSVLFLGLAIGTPKLAALGDDSEVKEKKIVDVNLELFAEEEKVVPPPPPVEPPPPPKIERVEFTTLEAVDKPVDEPPPIQEELDTSTVSTVTEHGEKIEEAPVVEESNEPLLWAAVEEKPTFPGGEPARMAYLQKNVRFPDMEAEQGVQGTVWVEFVIDRNGGITEPKVVRSVSAGIDKEALRVVKAMPAWTIGKQNGRPVPVRFTMPVKFTLR